MKETYAQTVIEKLKEALTLQFAKTKKVYNGKPVNQKCYNGTKSL